MLVLDDVCFIERGFLGGARIEIFEGPQGSNQTIMEIVSDHRISLVFDKDEFEKLIEGLLARHEQMT